MARTRNYRSKRRSTMRSKRQRNNTRHGSVRRKFRRNRSTRKGGNMFRRMYNKGKQYAREYGQGVSAASSRVASGISDTGKSAASGISDRRRRMKEGINAMREKSQARSQRANRYANCEEAKIQTAKAKKMYDSAVAQCNASKRLEEVYNTLGYQQNMACNPMEENDIEQVNPMFM